METSPCHNSVAGHQIATNFCTCYDSTAVVPCTEFCSDRGNGVEVRVKRNFHRIWIAMEKPLVKRGPVSVWAGMGYHGMGELVSIFELNATRVYTHYVYTLTTSTSAIAVERYLGVFWPLRYKQWLTATRIRQVFFLCYAYPLIVVVVLTATAFTYDEDSLPCKLFTSYPTWANAIISGQVVINIVIMITIYLLIIRTTLRLQKQVNMFCLYWEVYMLPASVDLTWWIVRVLDSPQALGANHYRLQIHFYFKEDSTSLEVSGFVQSRSVYRCVAKYVFSDRGFRVFCRLITVV